MGIILSSAYLFVIGKLSIRMISRISDVPTNLLYPIVLVFCVFGGYAINNTMFDVLVMMVVGLLGYAMLRFEVPAAPFLIAFILGPMLEDNFRQSLLLSEGELGIFFRTEICWIFWILTAVSVVLLVRNRIRDNRARKTASTVKV